MDIDRPLDELVTKRGRGRGRGRGNYRGYSTYRGTFRGRGGAYRTRGFRGYRGFRGTSSRGGGTPAGRWQHDMYNGGSGYNTRSAAARLSSTGVTRVLITNLDYGVSDTDIKTLFEPFGAMRKASINYDKSGRSLGTATVVFERRVDAIKAHKKYNNVPLDGRAMMIQIIEPTSGNTFSSPTRGGGGGGGDNDGYRGGFGGVTRRGTGGGRGRGGGSGGGMRGRGRGRGRGRPQYTAEQLDAELDKYKEKTEDMES